MTMRETKFELFWIAFKPVLVSIGKGILILFAFTMAVTIGAIFKILAASLKSR